MNMRRMLAAGALWAMAGAAVSFAGAPPAKVDRVAQDAALKALDKAWEETAVTFGPSDAGCPKADSMLSAMNAAPPPDKSRRAGAAA